MCQGTQLIGVGWQSIAQTGLIGQDLFQIQGFLR
jgi:hypothetical protein